MDRNNQEVEELKKHFDEIGDHLSQLGEILRGGISDEARDYLGRSQQTLQKEFDTAIQTVKSKEEIAKKRIREAGREADQYMREHPWQTAVAALLIGMLTAFLITTSGKKK